MKRDVFISYRRKGGIQTALWVKDRLEHFGYDVFLDIEGLDHGPFDEQLYAVIDNSVNFVLILSQGALERCADKDDWVRKEIMHALEMNKNIIPFMLEEFEWPEALPEEINEISKRQGLRFVTEYPAAVIDKLTSLLVKPKADTNNATIVSPSTKEIHDNKKIEFPVINNADIEVIEPHKKKHFGFGFDKNEMAVIISRLQELKDSLQYSLSNESQDSIGSYQNAQLLMTYVKKQLAAFNCFGFNASKAINIFIKNYETNLEDVQDSLSKGKNFLTDVDRRSLNQISIGLDDIIDALKRL